MCLPSDIFSAFLPNSKNMMAAMQVSTPPQITVKSVTGQLKGMETFYVHSREGY